MDILLRNIVGDNTLHGAWLNTLSFMENAGARKISASEDTHNTTLTVLKHAAEEHRHAYYLKKQIAKVSTGFSTYDPRQLLAPFTTMQYLNRLDVQACKYLKQTYKVEGKPLAYAAYLFVTYAIEVRADSLYPQYQEILTKMDSKVNVKSIILEEEGHLEEMVAQLEAFDTQWQQRAAIICTFEQELYKAWIANLKAELLIPQ